MVPLTFYRWTKTARRLPRKHFKERPETLGDHIRRRRILSGQLQSEVATIIGVCEDSITHWESNRSQPQVAQYPSIIRYLGYYPFNHEVETVSGKLLHIRNTKGYSYKALAPMMNVHASTVRSWEKNEHRPNAEKLRLIERLYRP